MLDDKGHGRVNGLLLGFGREVFKQVANVLITGRVPESHQLPPVAFVRRHCGVNVEHVTGNGHAQEFGAVF